MSDEIRLEKANESVNPITTGVLTAGGRLNREQANVFIDLTHDLSYMMKQCRTLRKDNPRGEFNRLVFPGPVTEGASENADSGNTYKPTHSQVLYDTVKFRTAIDVTRETLEENIAGMAYRDTVMGSLAKRVAEDAELLAILGDTVKYASDNSDLGRLLKHNNGWYKIARTGHLVDCAGAVGVTRAIFSNMIRALPSQYKMNRAGLRFYCAEAVEQDVRDNLSARVDSLGDSMLVDNNAVRMFGIPVVPVPLFPENMDSINGSNAWGDATFMWLTDPNNLIHVITRELDLYWEFKNRKDMWEMTMYTRIDNIIEEVDAIVTADDLRIKGGS